MTSLTKALKEMKDTGYELDIAFGSAPTINLGWGNSHSHTVTDVHSATPQEVYDAAMDLVGKCRKTGTSQGKISYKMTWRVTPTDSRLDWGADKPSTDSRFEWGAFLFSEKREIAEKEVLEERARIERFLFDVMLEFASDQRNGQDLGSVELQRDDFEDWNHEHFGVVSHF